MVQLLHGSLLTATLLPDVVGSSYRHPWVISIKVELSEQLLGVNIITLLHFMLQFVCDIV